MNRLGPDDPTTLSPALLRRLQQMANTPGCHPSIWAAAVLASVPPYPRIRVVARPGLDGNPVFWAVLDEVDPGDTLILTDGRTDWPARVTAVTDTLITAQDANGQWLFSRRGPRAGHIAGH